MTDLEMMMFYDSNKDFKRFVDANAKAYRKSPAYIMDTPTAREYYQSLQKGGCNHKSKKGEADQ
jgi:hypothetical protein